jgi:hypothetical protein
MRRRRRNTPHHHGAFLEETCQPHSARQGDALTPASFEAHCLPLTILARHHWPAMMIDLTGSEKTALNPMWSAP